MTVTAYERIAGRGVRLEHNLRIGGGRLPLALPGDAAPLHDIGRTGHRHRRKQGPFVLILAAVDLSGVVLDDEIRLIAELAVPLGFRRERIRLACRAIGLIALPLCVLSAV